MKKKIIIIVTVPLVLETWLKGQPRYLSEIYDVEIITSNAPSVQQIQKYENVSVKIVDFTRKINILKDLKVLFQLWNYFLQTKPNIIYTLTPKAGLLGMIASFFARVPVRFHNVVGLPHLEATGKKKVILELTEKITYLFATDLYCNSINLKNIMSTQLTSKPVNIIGNGSVNGVDENYFQDTLSLNEKKDFRKTLEISQEDFIITFVGRIVQDKGISELVEAFSQINQNNPNTYLLLIGDFENDLDPVSISTAKTIQNSKKIAHIPFQQDIRTLLSITDLFVLPSYREGLPNVLIEAGSMGIPLIATNINGCNEIIQDGINGLLCEKKDIESLKKAIEKLMFNKELYLLLKNNVRNSIIKRYSQKFFWEELKKHLLYAEETK